MVGQTKLITEPGIFLGQVMVGGKYRPFYLPLATGLSHTLITGRSNSGKSHTMATLGLGLAKACACRRYNLLTSAKLQNQASPDLISLISKQPPISMCLFDPHRSLAQRVLEDLTAQLAVIRVNRWLGAAREVNVNSNSLSQAQIRERLQAVVDRQRPSAGWWEDILEEMLVYLDLGDRANPFALNLLDIGMWESKENCASSVIEILSRIFPDSWGVRMEDLLRNTLFVLFLLNTCREPDHQFTLLDVTAFITVDPWREALLELPIIRRENPAVYAWWKIQFEEKMDERFRNEVIKPVLNKINPFVTSDLLSQILGQSRTRLDFLTILRQGGVVLVDLAASQIEAENAALAGAVLIGFLLKQARQLADQIKQEVDRPVVQLLIDEIAAISAAPYGRIFSEDRKFGIRATLATQSLLALDKLNPALRPLLMANQANLLVLQVNAEDAAYLREELVADQTTLKAGRSNPLMDGLTYSVTGSGGIGPDQYDLVNAEQGQGYFKISVGGKRQPLFSLRVAPRSTDYVDKERALLYKTESLLISQRIISRSSKTFGQPAQPVIEKLRHKSLDYLKIFRLSLPDFNKSELLQGFEEQTKVRFLESLQRIILTYRTAAEAQARSKRGYKKPAGPSGHIQDSSTDTEVETTKINQAKQPPATAKARGKKEGVSKTEPVSDLISVDRPTFELKPMPMYAPDGFNTPPVRNPDNPLEDYKTGLHLPDNRDYRPLVQIKQLKAIQARKKQYLEEEKKLAEQANQAGQQYGAEAHFTLQLGTTNEVESDNLAADLQTKIEE